MCEPASNGGNGIAQRPQFDADDAFGLIAQGVDAGVEERLYSWQLLRVDQLELGFGGVLQVPPQPHRAKSCW